MFKGTNLIQGENIETPREYDYYYFEYPSDTESKTYTKSEKVDKTSNTRKTVQVNGKDWTGKAPADKPTDLERYQAVPDAEKEKYLSDLFNEAFAACKELASKHKLTDVPELLLLEAATLGMDRILRVKLTPKKPKDIETILKGLEKDYRAAGYSEKKIAKLLTLQREALATEDEEEQAA